MREIKFKAKRVDNGEWVEGSYRYYHQIVGATEVNKHFIVPENQISGYEVHPETVCQYTGLKDKNGVEIWEGDILARTTISDGIVSFSNGAFLVTKINNNAEYPISNYVDGFTVVIGNIHDNNQ